MDAEVLEEVGILGCRSVGGGGYSGLQLSPQCFYLRYAFSSLCKLLKVSECVLPCHVLIYGVPCIGLHSKWTETRPYTLLCCLVTSLTCDLKKPASISRLEHDSEARCSLQIHSRFLLAEEEVTTRE